LFCLVKSKLQELLLMSFENDLFNATTNKRFRGAQVGLNLLSGYTSDPR
jgi:hypothetical protein